MKPRLSLMVAVLLVAKSVIVVVIIFIDRPPTGAARRAGAAAAHLQLVALVLVLFGRESIPELLQLLLLGE